MPNLFLVPVPLSESAMDIYSIQYPILNSIRIFIVESARDARRNLRRIGFQGVFDDCLFYEWDKHQSPNNDIQLWLKHCQVEDVALLSDAGCPAVADPGSDVVAAAHQLHIQVIPLVGPSSLLLALMSSGFNGQSFAFNGYLPVERKARKEKLRLLEQHSYTHQQTQLFIETPYRNQILLQDMLSCLHQSTRLCVALDLTSNKQSIITNTVKIWTQSKIILEKRPAVFLFLRQL